MAYDLCPLPPSLKPCEPIKTTETRYLNQSHTPITNSLKKALHIELYNEEWFDKLLHTSIPPFRYNQCTLNVSTKSFSSFTTIVELHNNTNTCPPIPLVEAINNTLSSSSSPLILHASLENTYCFFFIR